MFSAENAEDNATVQRMANTADKLAAQSQAATKYVSEEAIEELVAGMVDPMLENLYDPKPFFTRYKDPDTYAEIGYGMLIGGLMGGIGTGGKLLVNNVTGRASGGQDGTEDAGGSLPQSASLTAPSSEGALNGSSNDKGSLGENAAAPGNLTSPGVENKTAAPGEGTTAINDDPAQHTAAEQRVIEAYKSAADPELTGFIDRVRGLQNQDYKNGIRLTIRTQTENATRKAAELTGVDTSGYSNIINGSSVQHIDNRHGANGTADRSMANIEDFSRIGFVLDNFTDARVIPISELDAETRKLTKAWMNSDNTPAPLVQFSMPVNGTYYVVEAVPSSKAQVMAVVSAYMSGGNKNDSTLNQVLNLPKSPGTTTSSLTPEALHELLGADNGSVPQPAQNSNTQNSENRGIIDGARVPGYNRITKMEGAVTDGRAQTGAQLDRAFGEGVGGRSGVRLTGEGNASGRALGQGDLSTSGELRLTEVTDRAEYSRLLDEARTADPIHGWAVTPKTEKDLQICRIFLTEDGGVGFAIAPDGDIEAVFRNKVRHPQGKAMQSAMPQAIEKGGTKLDCYGAGLVNVYSKVGGFVPVARVAFNPEYANPGWTPDNGIPDIYVMMVTDTDPETVRQKQGSYHYWTDAELDALPLMEYDEAMAYRDRLLAEQHSYGREMARLKEAYKQVLAAYDAAADIDPEQAGARSEIKLARAILQSQYEAALTQARASGNADLANALYKELLRIQKPKQGDDR